MQIKIILYLKVLYTRKGELTFRISIYTLSYIKNPSFFKKYLIFFSYPLPLTPPKNLSFFNFGLNPFLCITPLR